jgi:hypothetical protein
LLFPCNVGGANLPSSIYVKSLYTDGNGFAITGSKLAGYAINAAGDVNGDGFPDIITSALWRSYAGSAFIVYGGKGLKDLTLETMSEDQGFELASLHYHQNLGYSVASFSDSDGNVLVALGTMNTQSDKDLTSLFTLILSDDMPSATTTEPTGIPTVSPTERPTAPPTIIPTMIPTRTPTIAPTRSPIRPPTFEENQDVILGLAIPAILSFVPIFFSRRLCLYALNHWSSHSTTRGFMQIAAYKLCKSIFVADYVAAKEAEKAARIITAEMELKRPLKEEEIELMETQVLRTQLPRFSIIGSMKDDPNKVHDESHFSIDEPYLSVPSTENHHDLENGASKNGHTLIQDSVVNCLVQVTFDDPFLNDIYYHKRDVTQLKHLMFSDAQFLTASSSSSSSFSSEKPSTAPPLPAIASPFHEKKPSFLPMKYPTTGSSVWTGIFSTSETLKTLIEHLPYQIYLWKHHLYPAVLKDTFIADGSFIDQSVTQFFQMTKPSLLNPLLITIHACLTSMAFVLTKEPTQLQTIITTLSSSVNFGLSLFGVEMLERFQRVVLYVVPESTNNQLSVEMSITPYQVETSSWKLCAATLLTYSAPTIVTCSIRSIYEHPVAMTSSCFVELASRLNYGINDCYTTNKHFSRKMNNPFQQEVDDEISLFANIIMFCIVCFLFRANIVRVANSVVASNYIFWDIVRMDSVQCENVSSQKMKQVNAKIYIPYLF